MAKSTLSHTPKLIDKKSAEAVEANFELICSRVACGELLSDLGKELGFSSSVFYRVKEASDEMRESYMRAREAQQHSWADEIITLSDKCRVGNKVTEKGDGTVETVTADMVERTRLQIESRKWLMARLNPKAYGDKITQEIQGKDGGPLVIMWKEPEVKP